MGTNLLPIYLCVHIFKFVLVPKDPCDLWLWHFPEIFRLFLGSFTSFSTMFQSYQNDEGSVQQGAVLILKESCRQRDSNPSPWDPKLGAVITQSHGGL